MTTKQDWRSSFGERIQEILLTLEVDNTFSPPVPLAPPIVCEVCADKGVVSLNVPPGHPKFGKWEICPNTDCPAANEKRSRRYDKMLKRSGLPSMYMLFDFDTWQRLPQQQRVGKELAAAAAWMFVERRTSQCNFSLREATKLIRPDDTGLHAKYSDNGKNWLVFQGGLGLGKTGLAASIVNELSALGSTVLYLRLQEMFTEIQSRYGKDEPPSADELFEDIRRAPVLILDECNIANVSQDKTRLMEELIRFRHARQLPTVLTCNVGQQGFSQMWGERTADVIFSAAHWIVLKGDKLRQVSSEVESF